MEDLRWQSRQLYQEAQGQYAQLQVENRFGRVAGPHRFLPLELLLVNQKKKEKIINSRKNDGVYNVYRSDCSDCTDLVYLNKDNYKTLLFTLSFL